MKSEALTDQRSSASSPKVVDPAVLPELPSGYVEQTGIAGAAGKKAHELLADPVAAIRGLGERTELARDVVVVGAGPAGLMTGLLLIQYGVPPERIQLIDAKSGSDQLSKASALQPGVFHILEQAGVLDRIRAESVPITGTAIHNRPDNELAEIDVADSDTPPALAIPQWKTEEILRNRLEELGVKIEWGTRLEHVEFRTDGSVTVQVDDGDAAREVTTRFLIGCDGMRSKVREEMQIPFLGDRMGDLFAVFDATVDWNQDKDPGQSHAFLSGGSMIFAVPLPGENRYRIFCVLPDGKNPFAEGERPTKEEDTKLIQDLFSRMGARLSPEEAAGLDLSYFKVDEKQAEKYQKGSVFLVGDAAHVHSPAGGQGMNTGLADAQNLAWKLARVIDGTAKEEILSTYDQERHPIAEQVLKDTGQATRIFSAGGVLGYVRDLLLPALVPFIGARVARHEAQLDLSYRGFGTVMDDGRIRGLEAGDRAPVQVPVQVWGGEATTLKDLMRRAPAIDDHVLLFDAPGREILLRKELSRALEKIKPHAHVAAYVVVDSEDEAARMSLALRRLGLDGKATILVDADESLRNAYRADREGFFVIRPDGYLGYQSEHLDGGRLLRRYLRDGRYYAT